MTSNHLARHIGSKISAARGSLPNLTDEMAARFLEVAPSDFRAMEQGMQRPTAEQLVLLADLFNVKPGWFLDGEGA